MPLIPDPASLTPDSLSSCKEFRRPTGANSCKDAAASFGWRPGRPAIRLSIVIPLLGDAEQLDDTLVSVLENRPPHCEVIVVHNEPYDDPYQLADEVRFVAAPRRATVAECLNVGLSASRAPVVHVLACGVEVAPGWTDAAVRRLGDAQVAAVAAMIVSRHDATKVVSAGIGYRSEGVAWTIGWGKAVADPIDGELCGPDIAAAFYCRSALEAIGGFSRQAAASLAGVDAALGLRRLDFHCVFEPQCVVVADNTSDDKIGFRFGRDAERLFWRWSSTGGLIGSLLGHVAMVVGECAIAVCRPSMLAQLAGRVWGAASWAAVGRRAAPVDALSHDAPSYDESARPPRQLKRAA